MTADDNLPLLLGSVAVISLTGVMMPGPVTAVTVTKGAQRKEAGALIAVGHGIVEFPLIALIYLGFAHFLIQPEVKIGVGLVGGLVLIWMARQMLQIRPDMFTEHKDVPHGYVITGLATTAANPYFLVWWATVGSMLLANARSLGGGSVVALGVTHWLCDFGWLYLLSWFVFKSKRLWTQKAYRMVFGMCAAILAGFGVWFIFYSFDLAISA